ncbi:MAG TPA: ATP-dependent DNA helicase RecG, partial [Candidatus Binataceae bacterium]|nr:ATP-dependent DNA helicase RecG [Candidatus Binataceae bacterium]
RTPIDELRPDVTAVVEGDLGKVSERPMRAARWRRLASAWLDLGARKIRLVWFNLPAYMRGNLPSNVRVLARGRIAEGRDGDIEIVQPELHVLDLGPPPPVRPVYRVPAIVGQRLFSTIVKRAMEEAGASVQGAVPGSLLSGLMPPRDAVAYLHEPPADTDVAALNAGTSPGHHALAFDELFAFELALARERERAARRPGIALRNTGDRTDRFLKSLPFELTRGQRTAIDEVDAGLAHEGQMNRMLMGDVGSGKTVVAFWAALRAIECGYQAAMMAPTELLAEQHSRSFEKLCSRLGVMSSCLTGRATGAPRAHLLRAIANGGIQMVFGTHALIQEDVRFYELGLAVIDEQHRFGVFDRAKMKALGPRANLLMMTATPIPRTLAMSLFANLDVSFLDELPPGRTPIATEIYQEDEVGPVHELMRREIASAGRVYYVVPLIDSDDDDSRSVAATAQRLSRGPLKGARIGTMHGRMRPTEKDSTMRAFRDGNLDVLVSTTVVEVGIDVPEATVIVIDRADRYGLAQLHQLRGRVGRGERPSRCCLIASRDAGPAAIERLNAMRECTTGAAVAEADLKLRGPGDLLGARQAGALPLRFIDLVRDYHMIEHARRMAEDWLRRDPTLESDESSGARAALQRMLALGFSLGDVG